MKPGPFRLLLAVIVLATASGCVVSEHPLSAVERAKADPRLAGVWQAKGEQNAGGLERISFDRHGWGQIAAREPHGVWKPLPGLDGFFVTRTGKGSYLNMLCADDEKDPGSARHYTFCKYTLSHDQKTLLLLALKSDACDEGVKQGKLKARGAKLRPADDFDTLILQDRSEILLRFIEARPTNEVFSLQSSYRKVH